MDLPDNSRSLHNPASTQMMRKSRVFFEVIESLQKVTMAKTIPEELGWDFAIGLSGFVGMDY